MAIVFGVSMPPMSGAPPTSAAKTPPLPLSPWHRAHFCAKIFAPCAGVPPPIGRPVPSGWMLMSHAAISAGSSGVPRFGPAAKAAPDPRPSARAMAGSLCVDMFHLPFAVDRPAAEAVVVLVREGQYVRDLLGLAALGHELGAGRLNVAALVPGAALQYGRTAVPPPGHAEPGKGLGEHRPLKRRLCPALAAVRRNHHLGNPAVARIGDAGDLVVSGPLQRQPRRGVGDEGLHFLHEIEPVRFSARQNLRVGPGLVIAHGRLLDEFQPAQEFYVHIAFPAREQKAHRIAVAGHKPLAVLV